MSVESLFAGALGADGVTVAVRLGVTSPDSAALRLEVTDSLGDVTTSDPVASASRVVKLPITGLTADTEYTYRIVADDMTVTGPTGSFRTLPVAAGTPGSFTFALSGDANQGSNHDVFDAILAEDPLFFLHLGDWHYNNIATNTQSLFQAAWDEIFAAPKQHALYRRPTVAIWDDHDYGPNNADGTSASHDAACAVYRNRVPHYPLADATVTAHIGHSFTVGRVMFIVTDQRSAANPKATLDTALKTMLGASQKAWFKTQVSAAAAAGHMIVWVCPRIFGGSASAGADHWGGFTFERAELVDYIQANASGRCVVLSADGHYLAIDDGSNHDFATLGSEPLPTFQCAPLDQTTGAPGSGATYSEGAAFTNVGQYGTMAVTDTGTSTIGVEWTGYNSAGTQLVQYSFSVTV